MKKLSVFKIALLLAALLFIIVLGFAFTGHIASAGPFAIAGFLALALGCRGYELTRGLTYTVVIFAAVTSALYYPQYFQVWGGFKLATLITPLIQIIMFGMGTSMGLKDFAGVIKTPKGVLIGVCSHFIIMPLIGFTLAKLSGLPPEIAAGIILIGCSPNGLASNVISYLAKANLALSITITAVSTLLAPFVTPFLMKWLAGAFVHIDALNMMWDIIKMVIIPIGGGIIFNRFFGGTTGHGEVAGSAPATGRRKAVWLDKAMPLVSMAGIACIIVIITAAGRNSLLTIGPLLVVFVLLHNLSGYTLGYWTGRLFRMDERDCRTMAIEVGMQNGGLASGLAKEMGKMATVGLAPAIFGPLMNVTGSILASWWHRKPPKDPSSRRRDARSTDPSSSEGKRDSPVVSVVAVVLLLGGLLAPPALLAQELWQISAGARSRVSSLENINGVKGSGGRANRGAKGSAFTPLKAGDSISLLDIGATGSGLSHGSGVSHSSGGTGIAGIIQRIWLTINDRSPAMLHALRLRCYWDGSSIAAVDVPVGDFFGAALGRLVPFESEFFSNPEGRSFNCYIPMPFRKGARMVITNEGKKDLGLLFFDVDFVELEKPAPGDLYFHSVWSRHHDPVGKDVEMLPKVRGRGRYLGVSVGLNVDSAYGATGWCEGEVKIYLDGDSLRPTINGTGSEDYLGTGWGAGVFAHRYQGCLVADDKTNQWVFYRYHVPDAIYFEKDCRVTIQQMGGATPEDVRALMAKGVALQPVSLAGDKGFQGLLDPHTPANALATADAKNDWLNFYRSDEYLVTAYYYLDKP